MNLRMGSQEGVRLLIELGEDPERALQRAREKRPGAVETQEQGEYVLRCAD